MKKTQKEIKLNNAFTQVMNVQNPDEGIEANTALRGARSMHVPPQVCYSAENKLRRGLRKLVITRAAELDDERVQALIEELDQFSNKRTALVKVKDDPSGAPSKIVLDSRIRNAVDVKATAVAIEKELESHNASVLCAAYGRIIAAFEDEICAWLFSYAAENPEKLSWRDHYILSLLSAMEPCDGYYTSIHLLAYDPAGTYTMVNAETLTEETDPAMQLVLLETLQEGLWHLDDDVRRFVTLPILELIPKTVIGYAFSQKDFPMTFDEAATARTGYLHKISSGTMLNHSAGDDETTSDQLATMLAGLITVHNFGSNNNEHLEDNWVELRRIAENCPRFSDTLTDYAQFVTVVHLFFTIVNAAGDKLPLHIARLIRLYIALKLDMTRFIADDTFFAWVTGTAA